MPETVTRTFSSSSITRQNKQSLESSIVSEGKRKNFPKGEKKLFDHLFKTDLSKEYSLPTKLSRGDKLSLTIHVVDKLTFKERLDLLADDKKLKSKLSQQYQETFHSSVKEGDQFAGSVINHLKETEASRFEESVAKAISKEVYRAKKTLSSHIKNHRSILSHILKNKHEIKTIENSLRQHGLSPSSAKPLAEELFNIQQNPQLLTLFINGKEGDPSFFGLKDSWKGVDDRFVHALNKEINNLNLLEREGAVNLIDHHSLLTNKSFQQGLLTTLSQYNKGLTPKQQKTFKNILKTSEGISIKNREYRENFINLFNQIMDKYSGVGKIAKYTYGAVDSVIKYRDVSVRETAVTHLGADKSIVTEAKEKVPRILRAWSPE